MNISELNHLENVNESSLVNGGYASAGSSGNASAFGILPSAGTSSYVSASNYGDYYYYYGGSEYASAGSSAGASALSGSASAGSSASGSASSSYYYYY
jgi:hypothetical protein